MTNVNLKSGRTVKKFPLMPFSLSGLALKFDLNYSVFSFLVVFSHAHIHAYAHAHQWKFRISSFVVFLPSWSKCILSCYSTNPRLHISPTRCTKNPFKWTCQIRPSIHTLALGSQTLKWVSSQLIFWKRFFSPFLVWLSVIIVLVQ